jgi:hypothetical protein
MAREGFISKQDRSRSASDLRWGMGQTIFVIVVLFVLVLVLNATGLLFKGRFMDAGTEIQRNTIQYETTQRTFIDDAMTTVAGLEADIADLQATDPMTDEVQARIDAKQAQVASYVNQAHAKASLIDEDDLSADQRSWLSSHPRS